MKEYQSLLINYHPLVQLLPSFVKDTTHLLNILDKEIDVLPTNAILVTLVVSCSLYTNIPTTEGIDVPAE